MKKGWTRVARSWSRRTSSSCLEVQGRDVQVSEKYFRPTEVETLLGDPAKAREKLGWKPEISFKELIYEMCLASVGCHGLRRLDYDMKQVGLSLPPQAKDILKRQECGAVLFRYTVTKIILYNIY